MDIFLLIPIQQRRGEKENIIMRISADQLRAARAILGMSQEEFGRRAKIAKQTIVRVESDPESVKQGTLAKIVTAYELAGIEFVTGGAKKTSNIIELYNHEGFAVFLDDVFETILAHGTPENPTQVFLSNVVHANWTTWMGEKRWKAHTDRMTHHKDIMDVRIIVKQGDKHFPASDYSQYKWVSGSQFNARSFYSYHDKLAFLNFKKNSVKITVMRQPEFAEGFRTLFLNTWEHVAIDPREYR